MIKIFLAIASIIFLVFGLIYLFSPESLASVAGLQFSDSGLTDIRATYGGFQIGFALFIGWCLRDESHYSVALVSIALIFGCVGAARFYGLVTDGETSTFHFIGLTFEVLITAFSVWLLKRKAAMPDTRVIERGKTA